MYWIGKFLFFVKQKQVGSVEKRLENIYIFLIYLLRVKIIGINRNVLPKLHLRNVVNNQKEVQSRFIELKIT